MESGKKSIMYPLSQVILRRYEKPLGLKRRDVLVKFCLSVGLLQPGDSRDIIVDVLFALLATRQKKESITSYEIREQIINLRKEYNLPLVGIADSNIRRQLKRLRELYLVEKVKNSYRITEFERLDTILSAKMEPYLLAAILTRIKEYASATEESFASL